LELVIQRESLESSIKGGEGGGRERGKAERMKINHYEK